MIWKILEEATSLHGFEMLDAGGKRAILERLGGRCCLMHKQHERKKDCWLMSLGPLLATIASTWGGCTDDGYTCDNNKNSNSGWADTLFASFQSQRTDRQAPEQIFCLTHKTVFEDICWLGLNLYFIDPVHVAATHWAGTHAASSPYSFTCEVRIKTK